MTVDEALCVIEGNCRALFESHGEPTAWEQRQAFSVLKRVALETVDQWMDIASAPRDGTRILAAGGAEVFTVEFTNGRFVLSPAVLEGPPGGESLADPWPVPTHWQPLPSPPGRFQLERLAQAQAELLNRQRREK